MPLGTQELADRLSMKPGDLGFRHLRLRGTFLHVHDLVDYVSEEAEIAGEAAARYALKQTADGVVNGKNGMGGQFTIKPGDGIRYVLAPAGDPRCRSRPYMRGNAAYGCHYPVPQRRNPGPGSVRCGPVRC